MKRMKIALMAMMAILMGTTFTSCLDSEDGPNGGYVAGVLDDELTGASIYPGNGIRFKVTNFEHMKFTNADRSETFYPKVVSIAFNEIEGEDYTEGKTSYNIYFAGYTDYYFGGNYMEWNGDAESLTPLYELNSAGEAYGYIWVKFKYYHKDTAFEDFSLYPVKWENSKLQVKLVHNKEVDTASASGGSGLALCFKLPSRYALQSEFPDIVFSGENQNEISIELIADGTNEQQLSVEPFKAIFSSSNY